MTSSDRFVVAVNGSAGSSDPDTVEEVCAALHEQGDVERTETSSPDDLDDLLRNVGDRTLVVVGGDGSIHLTVVRADALGLLPDLDLALVPMGTGNDLARTLEFPLDAVDAARALATAEPRTLDLIRFGNERIAVNAVHAGVGADAAERAQPMKESVGPLAYPVGALAAGVSVQGWDIEVLVDDEPLRPVEGERTLMVALGNGRTVGGGTCVFPDGAPGDGVLDVMVCNAFGPGARTAFATALMRGTHLERDDVAYAQGRRVTIRGQSIPYNVDGELVGERAETTFTLEPGAWRLRVPSRG